MNSIHPALLASELLFPYLYYFSCFIANVFFLSGPLSTNPTCPTFNVQRRIPLSFHPPGKRKSSDCLSLGTAQVSPFYKGLFSSVHRNIRRWMNAPSHSVAIGQPCRHIGWGRRKNYSLFDQQEPFEKPPAQELFKNWEIRKC
jgi:hypothetical protein